jgi:micrococcal nuclease
MRSVLILFFTVLLFQLHGQSICLVTRVIDGDTYQVLHKGKKIICRLANVDAPELDQYYGSAVRDTLVKLLEKRTFEFTFLKSDLYGRLVVEIKYQDKSLDEILVLNGWAWHYQQYSNKKEVLRLAELSAQIHNKGIWSCRQNVPPWIWRKLNKHNKRLNEKCL